MCGIIGVWNFNSTQCDLNKFLKARDLMQFRGPDQDGYWYNKKNNIFLGHRRLSIIDLSIAAKQPMICHNTGNVLVYNGEIYNFKILRNILQEKGYVFTTNSDSEVILAGYSIWGKEIMQHLQGIFAFAIWDASRQQLFIARDHFGVKPLYYCHKPSIFAFASSIEPLICLMNEYSFENTSLTEYVEMGMVSNNKTLLKDVCKIPPKSYLIVNTDNDLSSKEYWNINDFYSRKPAPFSNKLYQDIDIELENKLFATVESQLISDVPVGIFLSGGIDSTLLTAIVTKILNKPIKAYTISFDDPRFDEANKARNITKYLGCEHEILKFNAKELKFQIENYLFEYCTPMNDLAFFPMLMLAKFAAKDIKVCLLGDGGDELFLGYPLYTIAKKFNWLRHIPGLEQINKINKYLFPSKFLTIKKFLANKDYIDLYLSLRANIDGPLKKQWQAREFLAILKQKIPNYLKIPDLLATFDLEYYLPEQLLIKTDLSTMYNSIEGRVPFLDHKLAEFCLNLPHEYKFHKHPLKRLLGKLLPKHLWNYPKQGFNVPIDNWLRHEFKEYVLELPEKWQHQEILPKERLHFFINNHLNKNGNFGDFLWNLILFVKWEERLQRLVVRR